MRLLHQELMDVVFLHPRTCRQAFDGCYAQLGHSDCGRHLCVFWEISKVGTRMINSWRHPKFATDKLHITPFNSLFS